VNGEGDGGATGDAIDLVVPREAAGARLDRFLAAALASTERAPSRSELQRWITQGRVKVDGVARGAADKVTEGSRIHVVPSEGERSRALPETGVAFDVLYEDRELLIVNKPAGLVVHPARGHEGGTLVNGLLALGVFDLPRESIVDEWEGKDTSAHLRPGIVHRLDKGTSGIMVVARTARARERLKRQFQEHSIERAYEAIAVGDAVARVFSTLHGRHPKDRLRFTSHVREGKRAVTDLAVLERLDDGRATHVLCRLETGRTHQIRMHLSESGTPILGDPVYGKPPKDRFLRALADELGHQALHARVLGFTHPTTNERVRFEAPPPKDFVHALTELRAKGRALTRAPPVKAVRRR
jgi:23S rRNA pseudouridine1911/1915/1917 synthase